jgi:hypothetical protein
MPTQTYKTHRRLVPMFHVVLFLMLVANLVYSVIHLYRLRTYGAVVGLMMAVAWLLLSWYVRLFATTLQDRIIRLEEMVRYERCLPPDLRVRAGALTKRQMISLRFASDEELPSLVGQALDGKLADNDIKPQVKHWRADHLRV